MPPKKVGEWIETDTGNKISRRAQIHGPTNIILAGKSVISADVVLRGDLVRTLPAPAPSSASTAAAAKPGSTLAITIGRHVFIGPAAILRPPSRVHRGIFSYHPLKVGDNVHIEQGAVIEAASVGSNVRIGAGAVLGNMCIIKDGVQILDGAVVPKGMVVPGGVVMGGRPARIVGEVGVGWEGVERAAR